MKDMLLTRYLHSYAYEFFYQSSLSLFASTELKFIIVYLSGAASFLSHFEIGKAENKRKQYCS